MRKLTLTDWTGEPPEAESAKQELKGWLWRSSYLGAFLLLMRLSHRSASDAGLMECCLALFAATMTVMAGTAGTPRTIDRRRLTKKVKGMMDLPVSVPQIPVEVGYSVGGFFYGWDMGIVTFTQGMIHFHGSRSRFSLPVWDIDPVSWTSPSIGYSITAVAHLPTGKRSIDMKAIDAIQGVGKGFSHRFLATAKATRQLVAPKDAEFVFPPLWPHGEAPRRRWVTWIPALTFAVVCMPVLLTWSINLFFSPMQDALWNSLIVLACAVLPPLILLIVNASRSRYIDRLHRQEAEALAAQKQLSAQMIAAPNRLEDPDEQAVQRL